MYMHVYILEIANRSRSYGKSALRFAVESVTCERNRNEAHLSNVVDECVIWNGRLYDEYTSSLLLLRAYEEKWRGESVDKAPVIRAGTGAGLDYPSPEDRNLLKFLQFYGRESMVFMFIRIHSRYRWTNHSPCKRKLISVSGDFAFFVSLIGF